MGEIVKPKRAAALTVAVIGNPNCGKSTLFNALTGLKQKVGNYPGVTVEKKTGTAYSQHGQPITVIDLPGAYSLAARSPDEAVTRDVLLGRRNIRVARLEHELGIPVIGCEACNGKGVIDLKLAMSRAELPLSRHAWDVPA